MKCSLCNKIITYRVDFTFKKLSKLKQKHHVYGCDSVDKLGKYYNATEMIQRGLKRNFGAYGEEGNRRATVVQEWREKQ